MGSGQILSGFSERSIGGLFVTAGLMMGMALGMSRQARSVPFRSSLSSELVSIILGQVPVTCALLCSRLSISAGVGGLANGLIFGGSGLGGAVISLTMSVAVEHLGTA